MYASVMLDNTEKRHPPYTTCRWTNKDHSENRTHSYVSSTTHT